MRNIAWIFVLNFDVYFSFLDFSMIKLSNGLKFYFFHSAYSIQSCRIFLFFKIFGFQRQGKKQYPISNFKFTILLKNRLII